MGEKELELLADIIVAKIAEEFEIKHLSGNLVNTIQVSKMDDEIKIEIPAPTYDMLKYLEKGVVIHDGKGSYASELDTLGSSLLVPGESNKVYKVRPKNHIGYIDRIISKAIIDWQGMLENSIVKVEG